MDEPIKVAFVALGCVKNLVDSEKMLGQIADAGAIITGGKGTAPGKMQALREAGVQVCASPAQLGSTMLQAMTAR